MTKEEIRFSRKNLQSSARIREHIDELWSDYRRSENKLVLHFIQEWQQKYNDKLIEEKLC